MIIPVLGLGQHGIVPDQPREEMPLNAWTAGRNVRFRDGGVEVFSGHVASFSVLPFAPKWLMNVLTLSGLPLWLYAGDFDVGATDGEIHTLITRTSGQYTPNPNIPWTGASVEDIPVINNGADIPQMWNPSSLSTPLQDLTGWNSAWRVNTLRALKRYLIGFDVSKSGVRFPNMIKWSHQAASGQVPQIWDAAPDNDAGEWVLPSEGGFIVDAVPQRDFLMIYKERESWLMQYVGTAAGVFTFNRKFKNVGILSRAWATEFFSGQHAVFTGDDFVVHDGQNADSVIYGRAKKLLNNIDSTNYTKAFVVTNYDDSEVWLCIPEQGNEFPNVAIVWNWKYKTIGIRELPNVSHISPGVVIPPSGSELWDQATGTWDTDTEPWGDRASQPTRQEIVMASPGATRLYTANKGRSFAGTNMTAYVERSALGFPTKHDGPPDFTRMKQIISLWPRISGTIGGKVNVYLGTQEKVDGPVSWSIPQVYTIGETDMMDFSDSESGRVHALKFESRSDIHWKLSAYEVDVVDRGMY